MQEIMTGKVGIFRAGKDLEEAVDELQKLLVRSRNIGAAVARRRAPIPSWSPPTACRRC